jgi:predicted porin
MKKTLVALAALASVSAFAQSSVTLDGYFDRAVTVANNTNSAKSTKGLSSAAGTTTVGIKGVEDLGNGLKAGFWISTDWADLAGTNQDTTTPVASSIQTGGFANSQSFIELVSAQAGTIRLGSVNNEILTNATSVAGPAFSTGIGSSYSSSFSTGNGIGTGTSGSGGIAVQQAAITSTANAGARGIRQANTVKYISPKFYNVTVAFGQAAQNDQGSAGTGDTVGVTDSSIRYTNGPVDVMYTTLKYAVGANTATNGGLTAGSSTEQSLLGAAYQVLPTLKLHAGFGETKSSTNTFKGKSTQYGVTYNVTPMIDVLAQVAKFDDTSTTNVDRKLTGLGVNYNFTKTTRAYLRYDSINYGSNVATALGSELKRTAIGVSKSF